MINRKLIVNSPDDRLRQFNRMPIPSFCIAVILQRLSRKKQMMSTVHFHISKILFHQNLVVAGFLLHTPPKWLLLGPSDTGHG